MPFAEVIAQERALSSLRAALRRGTLHHAYLFAGPEGVGKASAARLLAQAANCEAGIAGPHGYREDPCGTCGPCHKIEKGIHPDVIVLADERAMVKAGRWESKSGRAASRDIVVDQVRDLVDHRLALRRYEGRRRFVVIDPADAMNPQAQNALLKTLEEPPDDTTLVLVASGADSLLPTIRSRCLRVPFGPIPAEEIVRRLEKAGHDPDAARLAAALSGGSLGRALSLDDDELEGRRSTVEQVAALTPADPVGWFELARGVGEKREWAEALCELLLVWLRDVAVARAGGCGLALPDLAPSTMRVAGAVGATEALRRRDEVRRTLTALGQNAQPVLALERLFIGWFHGHA